MLASTFITLLGFVAPLVSLAAPTATTIDERGLLDIDLDICISVDLNLGGLLRRDGLLDLGGNNWGSNHPGGTCGDLSKVNQCYQVGHACDAHCECVPPPPNQCTDTCSIMKCQSSGWACNSDCTCKQTCDCQEQFDCWKQGGRLDSDCHCVVASHGGWKKRDLTHRDQVCTAGLTACKAPGSSANAFDCLDTRTSIDSCGGCVSEGQGTDCSSIEGVADVSCISGGCQVNSCASGYKVSENGTSCDPVDVEGINNRQVFIGSLKNVEKFWAM